MEKIRKTREAKAKAEAGTAEKSKAWVDYKSKEKADISRLADETS